MITSLKEDGDNWIGKAKILDTPMGNIVKNLMDEGAQLGVSSRALVQSKKRMVSMKFKMTLSYLLPLILWQTHPLQMPLLEVLWRTKNG